MSSNPHLIHTRLHSSTVGYCTSHTLQAASHTCMGKFHPIQASLHPLYRLHLIHSIGYISFNLGYIASALGYSSNSVGYILATIILSCCSMEHHAKKQCMLKFCNDLLLTLINLLENVWLQNPIRFQTSFDLETEEFFFFTKYV
jgi:hypothetical protein